MNSSEFTISDVLGCLAADLADAAQRVATLPDAVQGSAAEIELTSMTTAKDDLSLEVARMLTIIAVALQYH